ncbi:MAG: DUF465 domain-containing protein [Desulfovibrionaceae bacterium]|jgi:uncharacterized protein YdcH (DUF465 family)|nr:DUF465 domain-containing protein [Desulfovibrionaceae bacterium]
MEQRDLVLIEKMASQDSELKALWEEHLLYETQLEKLESKPFLTPAEERVVKEIKKKKLGGKTKIQAILDRSRQMEE